VYGNRPVLFRAKEGEDVPPLDLASGEFTGGQRSIRPIVERVGGACRRYALERAHGIGRVVAHAASLWITAVRMVEEWRCAIAIEG